MRGSGQNEGDFYGARRGQRAARLGAQAYTRAQACPHATSRRLADPPPGPGKYGVWMPETAGIHPREIFSPPAGNDGTPGEGAAGTVSNLDTGAQPVSSSTGEFCGPFGRGGYVRAPVCLCVGRRVRERGLRPTSPTLKKFWGADVQDRGHPLA
mgnify:CR=1 FL=1